MTETKETESLTLLERWVDGVPEDVKGLVTVMVAIVVGLAMLMMVSCVACEREAPIPPTVELAACQAALEESHRRCPQVRNAVEEQQLNKQIQEMNQQKK